VRSVPEVCSPARYLFLASIGYARPERRAQETRSSNAWKTVKCSGKVSARSRVLWVLIKETAVVGRLLRARPKSCTFTPRLVTRAWRSQSDLGKLRPNTHHPVRRQKPMSGINKRNPSGGYQKPCNQSFPQESNNLQIIIVVHGREQSDVHGAQAVPPRLPDPLLR
jgi:hypothetical protein